MKSLRVTVVAAGACLALLAAASPASADSGTASNFRGLTPDLYTTYYVDLSATVDSCPTDGRYCGWFPVSFLMPESDSCLVGYHGSRSNYLWVGPVANGNTTVSGTGSATAYSFAPGPQPWRICTYIKHSSSAYYAPFAQWTYSAGGGLVAGPAPDLPPGYVPPNRVPNPSPSSPPVPSTPTTPAAPAPVHKGPPTVASIRYGKVMRINLAGLDSCSEGTLAFTATAPGAKTASFSGDTKCSADGDGDPKGGGIWAQGDTDHIDLGIDGRERRTVTRNASWRLTYNGANLAQGRVQLKRSYTPPRKGRGYKIWSDTNFDDYYNICLDGHHNTYAQGGRIYCWETTRYPRSARWTDSTRKLK